MGTFLLTWNEDRFGWEEYDEGLRLLKRGKPFGDRWSAGGTQQISRGDRLFMLRQGKEPRGIVALGHAASDWFFIAEEARKKRFVRGENS